MKRLFGTTLALLCLAVITITLSRIFAPEPQLARFEYDAVLIGDSATVRLMPSRFSHLTGVCLPGQRLTVMLPSIFDFYRARCDNIDGWVSREQVEITD